jgi:hypothetical protein
MKSIVHPQTTSAYSQPVSVHIGAVKARRKAHPSVHMVGTCPQITGQYSLSLHPVLFSNIVKASLVDTLLSPEQTSRAMMAAIVVPTVGRK